MQPGGRRQVCYTRGQQPGERWQSRRRSLVQVRKERDAPEAVVSTPSPNSSRGCSFSGPVRVRQVSMEATRQHSERKGVLSATSDISSTQARWETGRLPCERARLQERPGLPQGSSHTAMWTQAAQGLQHPLPPLRQTQAALCCSSQVHGLQPASSPSIRWVFEQLQVG